MRWCTPTNTITLSASPTTIRTRGCTALTAWPDIRILDEPRSETPAQKQEAQDAVYAFVGAPERVVLHCDRAVLDDVLDRFGTDIQVFERDEQTFTAVLTTPPRGVRFWALQYLSFVEVAEPAWLRDEIMESIARNQYTNRKDG